MAETILGISAYYHDSAAALIRKGIPVAAAQEERFSRKKHDASFPSRAVGYVLEEAGLSMEDIDAVAFYEKPYIKFERLLETYHALAPRGLKSFLASVPVWIKEKLFQKTILKRELTSLGAVKPPPILFPEHHLSHAASAFYPSPFDEAAILTIDGVGEWDTTTIGFGEHDRIKVLRKLEFPHSLGLLYSSFTEWCGFRVNSGEYKLMGLAPYGRVNSGKARDIRRKILDDMVDLRADGSFLLNMDFFDFATGLTMCNRSRWLELFAIPRRVPETEPSSDILDMASAIQDVTEEIVIRLARTASQTTGKKNLVMAGGTALNCVVNGKLLKEGLFEKIWIQPASGDAGGALGAALAAWHIGYGEKRTTVHKRDSMAGSYLGPEYCERDVLRLAERYDAPCKRYDDRALLSKDVAGLIARGKVVGWFQGRMEYGPRALGNRSILADPRNPDMQRKLNVSIKMREGFRPFAPSVMEEYATDYFDLGISSPYMLFVALVVKHRCRPQPEEDDARGLYERLYHQRSDIPSVTHVDYTARAQTVSRDTNPRFWDLLHAFKQLTGYGMLVNTSFNVRGEPIVCSPEDAYSCFMRTGMDYLVMENVFFDKALQPEPADRILSLKPMGSD